MPIRYRLVNQLGLLAAALIFVAIGLGMLWGAQRFIADANLVAHTNQLIAHIDAIEARLRDAEAAQRGYLLTGRVADLADYRSGREQLAPLFDELRELVQDNPEQIRRAQALQLRVEQRVRQLDGSVERYHSDGLAAAQGQIGRDPQEVSHAIRLQSGKIRAVEQQLLADRARSSRDSANVLRGLALLGMPLGILVTALVYWLLVREIRRRARAESIGADAQRRLLSTIEQLEANTAHLRELSRYGSLLQSCASADEAIQLTAQLLSRLLPDTGGTLYRIRASQDYAEEATHWGRHAAASVPLLRPGDCWALRRGQAHVLGEDGESLRCAHISPPADGAALTAVCLPLEAQGAQLGLVYLSSPHAAFLERLGLVKTAAEQLSMALSNLSLQERLRIQSIREPLTGLFNRRYLEESLPRELSRCERRGLPLSLMMLDLDHFKAFNDQHGHAGGDALLARLGQLFADLSRTEDIACRYGGEEFTLILPETPPEAAMERAESIRAAVGALRVHHLGQELPKVTVSIGLSFFPGHGGNAEVLLRRADEALYSAKRHGRNRVEAAPPP